MLSIVIPVLNEEEYLPLTLSEIKKQNFSDYEIIVADAGSNDKSVEIAKDFGCIIIKGGLPAKGRNEGARIAKGDTLLFVDADLVFLPENFLENVLKVFEERKLKVASFPLCPKGRLLDKIIYTVYNFFVKISQRFFAFATNIILVKKEVFEAIGGFDEKIKIGEDHDFVKRAAKIAKFGFIETKPVLVSDRRLRKEGRLRVYGKYFGAALYMLFLGPVKKDFFHYQFGHYKNNNK